MIEATEIILNRQISNLQAQIQQLQQRLVIAEQQNIGNLIGPLRLSGAVTLYIGDNQPGFIDQLHKDFGSELANRIHCHLFDLNKAPISPEARDALKLACRNRF